MASPAVCGAERCAVTTSNYLHRIDDHHSGDAELPFNYLWIFDSLHIIWKTFCTENVGVAELLPVAWPGLAWPGRSRSNELLHKTFARPIQKRMGRTFRTASDNF